MTSTVRVASIPLAFAGWKGTLDIDGDVLRVQGKDPSKQLDIDTSEVKRYSFNGTNGLWAIRMTSGKKLYLQVSGTLLSADRSAEGRNANAVIKELLTKHGAKRFP